MNSTRLRMSAFAVVSIVCLTGGAGYVVRAAGRDALVTAAAPGTIAAATAGPHVLFRSMEGDTAGRLAALPLDGLDGPRAVTDLECGRVYAAGGQGVCLADSGGFLRSASLRTFGPGFAVRHRRSLEGWPSRARVSPDARWASTTTFVEGDSYAADSFSTRTTLVDLDTGAVVADLEQFTVEHDGKVIDAPDFNFWGVTFARAGDGFYATLATGGHTYLVRGDISERRVRVLRDGVECPSLSPDGRRIAFKHKVSGGFGPVTWRPAVLDVDTLEEQVLPEDRNVDDQIEWLDDDTVLYAVDTGSGPPAIWSAAADGSSAPRLFLEAADSPSVVRPG